MTGIQAWGSLAKSSNGGEPVGDGGQTDELNTEAGPVPYTKVSATPEAKTHKLPKTTETNSLSANGAGRTYPKTTDQNALSANAKRQK